MSWGGRPWILRGEGLWIETKRINGTGGVVRRVQVGVEASRQPEWVLADESAPNRIVVPRPVAIRASDVQGLRATLGRAGEVRGFDGAGDGLLGRAEGEQRPDQQIEGD